MAGKKRTMIKPIIQTAFNHHSEMMIRSHPNAIPHKFEGGEEEMRMRWKHTLTTGNINEASRHGLILFALKLREQKDGLMADIRAVDNHPAEFEEDLGDYDAAQHINSAEDYQTKSNEDMREIDILFTEVRKALGMKSRDLNALLDKLQGK